MRSRASVIDFPFGRTQGRGPEKGTSYSLAELKHYESQLSAKRKSDGELSNELRAAGQGRPRWIKFRNEELVPLLYYVKHTHTPDDALFRVMPEHNDTDVELKVGGATEHLQICVAYPDWAAAGVTQPGQSAGKYHRLMTEILNRDGGVGVGPITEKDGVFSQEPRVLSTSELLSAHTEGLQTALAKKLAKTYHAHPLSLLVHAVAYRESMSLETFHSVVRNAFVAAKANIEREIHFNEIYVLDSDVGYFVRLRTLMPW